MTTETEKARYLITGGSGFLGINLIRYLLDRGHDVRSIDLVEFTYPERGQIDAIVGDIRDRDTMDRVTRDRDVVVHCAAALPLYSREEIFTTDVEGTGIVLETAQHHGVQRVIHISSTAVYGIPDHHPLLETDTLHGVGSYGEAKILAEEKCLAARAGGMTVPILRPKSFVGPERLGVFALLYDWALDGRNFPMIGNGRNRYQLLDVEDLCEAIYLCATLPATKVNDTFNIGAKEFNTMREDYQTVLDAAGFGKRIIGFPAQPVIWALRFLELLHLSPLYKWVYETASEDSYVSIEKAENVLGFKPKYSNAAALLRNFQWYKKHRGSFVGQSGVSHRVPWKQGALGVIKKLF